MQKNAPNLTSPVRLGRACSTLQSPADFDYEALLRQSSAHELDGPADDIHCAHSSAPDPGALPSTAGPKNAGDAPAFATNPACHGGHVEKAGLNSEALEAPPPNDNPGALARSLSMPKGAPASEPTAAPSGANRRRQKRRRADKAERGQLPSSKTVGAFVKAAPAVPVAMDCAGLPAAAGAYIAVRSHVPNAKKVYAADELVNKLGFTYVPWGGVSPVKIVDSHQRVCAVLAGRPDDPSYVAACKTAHGAIEEEGKKHGLAGRVASHRRGHFAALNVGIMHGRTSQPVNLDNKEHAPLVRELLGRHDLQRMAGFASASFAAHAKGLYSYYKQRLDPLYARMPELKRIFPRHVSIFPTAAFNFGPNVWTYKHRDALNCPFGWCSIQAMGEFDPTQGGHLVLWEMRLVVEFPPGSCVLIPSATITHSNIPVAPGGVRTSFTQYAPGGLFRYVDYGFRLEDALKLEDPGRYEEVMKRRADNWRVGLCLLDKLDKLPGALQP